VIVILNREAVKKLRRFAYYRLMFYFNPLKQI